MSLYKGYIIYGPYLGKDCRFRIVLVKDDIKRTISYPKYLMEIHLNRQLKEDEEVHHIDENPLNNDLNNLEIKTRITHKEEHKLPIASQEFNCPHCNRKFTLKGEKLRHAIDRRKTGSIGPFCSRQCVGKTYN